MFRKFQEKIVQALRWSEKYTGTDMVYLAHGSFWLSGSSIITGAVSFGLALAFANLFSKDEYGTYKYILTLFGILSVASLRSMDMAISQGAARGNDRTVVTGMRDKMQWSLLGSVGAFLLAAYYFYSGNSMLGTGLIFAAFFIPLMEPFGVFNAVLVGKRNFRLSSLMGIAGQIGAAVPLIIALWFTNNPVIIFIVYAASWSLSRYISLKITLKKYPPNNKSEPGALSFALHSGAINASNVLISSLDSILIFHYLGAAELAIFSFAAAPVSHARAILNTPSILATPKLTIQDSASVRAQLGKRTAFLFILGIIFTVGYCALAYPFYLIFFPQYIEAVPYSILFSLMILLQVTHAFLNSALESRITLVPRRLLYLWNIPSLVSALCAILLIKNFGLWGAIAGQVITYAVSWSIAWILWRAISHKELPPAEHSVT